MMVHRLTTFERIGVLPEIEHVWENLGECIAIVLLSLAQLNL